MVSFYNVMILNLTLSLLLFFDLLMGLLYDAQATKTADSGNTCVGAHHYRLVFIVISVACIFELGLDILLSIRINNLYVKIYASKKTKKTNVVFVTSQNNFYTR